MKQALLVVAFAFGVLNLTGCSSNATSPSTEAEVAPKDSGAGVDAAGKKGPRIPPINQ